VLLHRLASVGLLRVGLLAVGFLAVGRLLLAVGRFVGLVVLVVLVLLAVVAGGAGGGGVAGGAGALLDRVDVEQPGAAGAERHRHAAVPRGAVAVSVPQRARTVPRRRVGRRRRQGGRRGGDRR